MVLTWFAVLRRLKCPVKRRMGIVVTLLKGKGLFTLVS